jgi:competence protein ComEC
MRSGRYRASGTVHYLQTPDEAKHIRSRALFYFLPDSAPGGWRAGDEIWLSAVFQPLLPPANPGELNMKRHYGLKGIHSRTFVSSDRIARHKSPSGFSVRRFFAGVRKSLSGRMDAFFRSPKEAALGKALVFGYKSELDQETVNAFSRSGTSHVLAVSGLHVGIIWLLIDKLLFPLNRTRRTRWIKFGLSLSALWFYALLTGMSPSVTRAAFMFSFMALAAVWGKRYNSFNMLAFSAFILLVLNPPVLFSPGFQLSYSAVAGILLMYPLFNGLVYFSAPFLRHVWSMVSITMAAQLATTPVTLHWFGSFPLWFPFSNLFIVPLTGVTVYSGVSAVALASVPVLGDLTAHLFQFGIKLLLHLAEFFSDLPYAALSISLTLTEGVAVALCLAFTVLLLQRRRFYYFAGICLTLTLLVGGRIYREFHRSAQEKWVAYSLKRGSVFRYVKGRTAYEWVSPTVDSSSYRFSVAPSDQLWGIRKKMPLTDQNGFISVPGFSMVILQPGHFKGNPEIPITCDVVVPGPHLRYLNTENLLERFRFRYLLLTGDLPRSRRERIFTECQLLGIPALDLTQSGWKDLNPPKM